MEDSYLDAAYEDRTCLPDFEDEREVSQEELDWLDEQDRLTDEELEAQDERDRDRLLAEQELQDFENHYGPCDDYDGPEW